MLFFWNFYSNNVLQFLQKILFISDNNMKCLDLQISILEWFQKDHVALKIGVMTAEYSALPSHKLYFKLFLK